MREKLLIRTNPGILVAHADSGYIFKSKIYLYLAQIIPYSLYLVGFFYA